MPATPILHHTFMHSCPYTCTLHKNIKRVYLCTTLLGNAFLSILLIIVVSPMMQEAYQEALEKHGSVSVDVMQCIFVGPSAVGKSSLKHLLVHNAPKAVKTGTAVIDTPEVVTVSSEQYVVEGGTSAWQQVSDNVMGRSLQACVNTKAYNEGQYPELFQRQDGQHQQMEEEDNPHQPAPLNVFQKFTKLCSRVFTH